MDKDGYTILNPSSVRASFDAYVAAVEIPIIDYVAIGVQDSIHRTSTSLMSCQSWQETFKAMEFASHDPVRNAALNTPRELFTFDDVPCQTHVEKEIMRQRKRHAIENGIVIMQRHLSHNFMLTLATGYKQFLPYRFLRDHHGTLALIFADLIQLVKPVTTAYQCDPFNYRCDDAK